MTAGVVALTGATGFLGRRLMEALLGGGRQVRALIRRPEALRDLDAVRPHVIVGDLADRAALAQLTAGAAVTIHCAGLIKARRTEQFLAVNREGSRAVAEAVGEGRLLMISSLAARAPPLSDYAASKRAGEEAARAVCGARLTIVRPPAIYGPGDRETLALFQLADRAPVLPLLAGPQARLAVAHVDDVVATILHLLDRPDLEGTYAVGGDQSAGYSWREIFGAAAQALGRTARFVSVPPWMTESAAALSSAAAIISGATPIFTPGKAREILHPDWSVAAAELAPGAPPARYALAAGFANTVAWYRAKGWL